MTPRCAHFRRGNMHLSLSRRASFSKAARTIYSSCICMYLHVWDCTTQALISRHGAFGTAATALCAEKCVFYLCVPELYLLPLQIQRHGCCGSQVPIHLQTPVWQPRIHRTSTSKIKSHGLFTPHMAASIGVLLVGNCRN